MNQIIGVLSHLLAGCHEIFVCRMCCHGFCYDVRHHRCLNGSGRVTSPSFVLNIVHMKLVSFVQITFTTY